MSSGWPRSIGRLQPVEPPPARRPARRPSVADALAPRVGPDALRQQHPLSTVGRLACGLVVVVLTALFLYVTISSALIALGDPDEAADDSGSDGLQVFFYLVLLAGALTALLAAAGVSGVRAAGFPAGAGRRLGRLLVGSAATVYVPLVACTTAYVVIAAFDQAPQANSPRQSTAVGLAASVSSGIGEEVFVVVVPVVLLGPVVAWAARRSPDAGRAATVALVVLMVLARLSYHLYYGPVVLVLLPWAVLTVLVYLRTRAVLPLMICHVGYDAVLQLPGLFGVGLTVLLAVAGAVGGAVLVAEVRAAPTSGDAAVPR